MAIGDIVRSTATGAGTGAAFGNPLIGGAAGLLLGVGNEIFGTSDEEERQKRYQEFLRFKAERRQQLLADRDRALREGAVQIGKSTEGMIRRERGDATRRMMAAGRNDAESYQLPVTGKVAEMGSNAQSDFAYRTDAEYNRALQDLDNMDINAAWQFADRPIQPNLVDTITEIAPAAAQAYQGYKYGEALNKFVDSQNPQAPPPAPAYGNSPYTPYRYKRQNPDPLFNY